MADRVDTDEPRVNEAIQLMKEVGDDLTAAQYEIADCKTRIFELESMVYEDEDAVATLDRWADLLEDFKRGVKDRDELFAGTVGK